MDQLEQEDEAFNPQAEILHNFVSDDARRRVEARRALNFPGLHTPVDSETDQRAGPSGLPTSGGKMTEQKSSDDEKVDQNEKSTSLNRNSNSNSNNNFRFPEVDGFQYDEDYRDQPISQSESVAVHSTPTVVTTGPPFVANVVSKNIFTGFPSRSFQQLKGLIKRGKKPTNDILDSSYRSDNAQNQGTFYY